MISQNLQQGLFNLIYFTWLHNSQAIAYFFGIILTLYLQFKNPNRKNLLFFVGFLFLFINFEYQKHFVDPILEQTLQTVLEQGATGQRFQQITNLFLQKIIPFSMYIIGWGSIFWALFISLKSPDKPKNQ